MFFFQVSESSTADGTPTLQNLNEREGQSCSSAVEHDEDVQQHPGHEVCVISLS